MSVEAKTSPPGDLKITWDQHTLLKQGLSFLESHKQHYTLLAQAIIRESQALTFLTPFDGRKIKARIIELKQEVAVCQKSAQTVRKASIETQSFGKIDQIALQSLKHMIFLESLENAIERMEAKNPFVVGAVFCGSVAVTGGLCSIFAAAVNHPTRQSVEVSSLCTLAIGLFSSVLSPFYHLGSLTSSYQVRVDEISRQLKAL